jgi:hypothetical protein
VPDTQVPVGAYLTPNSYFPPELSSPHPYVNVVVFADGHVDTITHSWMTQYANQLWSWNNTTPFTLP